MKAHVFSQNTLKTHVPNQVVIILHTRIAERKFNCNIQSANVCVVLDIQSGVAVAFKRSRNLFTSSSRPLYDLNHLNAILCVVKFRAII